MQRRPSGRRRIAAGLALLALAVTLLVAAVALVQDLRAGVLAVLGLSVAVGLAWLGLLQSGPVRWLLVGAGVAVLLAVPAGLAATGLVVEFWVVLAGLVLAAVAVRVAFGRSGSAGGGWSPAARTVHPVVLINPRSGGGRAERAGLVAAARARGIEPVVLRPGDDLEALARQAIANGADAIGMAGGDGSMAIVAGIAAEHDVPFVCIPAGTRNHFALDLGVRRDDVVGALDAFTDGVESKVDLASVNDRVFVNNVSLGVYGQAVQDPGYRDAKIRTILRTLSSVRVADGSVPALRITDDLGREHRSVVVMLVSNNPYALDRALGRSTRPRMDGGRLGVVLVGAERGENRVWDAPTLEVAADAPAALGVDGEAITLQPPLRFASRPARLRVRISARHPGMSPSGLLPPTLRDTLPLLVRMARGAT
jgi:diacylglycerol kinase family enzyme